MADEKDLGLKFPVGTRVLDTATGKEAVVMGGRIEHNPDRQFISVEIGETGQLMERSPEDLHALPAALAVPLEELER